MSAASGCGVALEGVCVKSLTSGRTPSSWSWRCDFPRDAPSPVTYRIKVSVAEPLAEAPHVVQESLHYPHLFGLRMHAKGETGFQTEAQEKRGAEDLTVSFFPKRGTTRKSNSKTYPPKVPILFQVSEDTEGNGREARALSRSVLHELRDFWFLDLSPTQMRIPSPPGQTALGDQGENLSSVLAAICADASWKQVLLEWVRKLTPMDVDDLIFDQDAAGQLLLRLVEKDGRSVSALSASDGTLRFLAILAALLGPEPASFYFIEELENGVHPTRLGLLVDLIQSQTSAGAFRLWLPVIRHCYCSFSVRSRSSTPLSPTGFPTIRMRRSNASLTSRTPDG